MRTERRNGPATILLAAALAGCGGGDGGTGGAAGRGETVVVDGSSTVFPISAAAQESYADTHPGARVKVDRSGTGGGFGRYLRGEIDIVDASREAKPGEEAEAEARGLPWTRLTIGYDGITVVVNRDNDWVDALTVDQLRRIYEPDSRVATWKDVDPSWPDRKIILFSPDDDSGTYDYFVEAILPEAEAQRKDLQASSDDNTLVTGVEGDRDALGYFGFAYYASNADRLRAVPIKAGDDAPAVTPSVETIFDKSYTPLARPLFLFVKNASMERPEVADFVGYYLDHIAELTTEVGYIAPTEQDRVNNAAALKLLSGEAAAGPAGGEAP